MTKDFEAFFQGYLECALWAETDYADESGGEPLDANYTVDDITKESLAAMRRACAAFWQSEKVWLINAVERVGSYSYARAGHDFWLTRNRHGVGFWDRGLGEVGERLTEAAHSVGESGLYVAGGKVHVS